MFSRPDFVVIAACLSTTTTSIRAGQSRRVRLERNAQQEWNTRVSTALSDMRPQDRENFLRYLRINALSGGHKEMVCAIVAYGRERGIPTERLQNRELWNGNAKALWRAIKPMNPSDRMAFLHQLERKAKIDHDQEYLWTIEAFKELRRDSPEELEEK